MLFQDARVWVLFPLPIDVEFLFLEGKQREVRYVLVKKVSEKEVLEKRDQEI